MGPKDLLWLNQLFPSEQSLQTFCIKYNKSIRLSLPLLVEKIYYHSSAYVMLLTCCVLSLDVFRKKRKMHVFMQQKSKTNMMPKFFSICDAFLFSCSKISFYFSIGQFLKFRGRCECFFR